MNDQTFYTISGKIALDSSSPISFGKTIETPEWVDIKVHPNITYVSNSETQFNAANIKSDQYFSVGNNNYFQTVLELKSNLVLLNNQSKIIFNVEVMKPKNNASLVLHNKKSYISTVHTNDTCSKIRVTDLQSKVQVNTTHGKDYGLNFNINYKGDFINTEKLFKLLEVTNLQNIFKIPSNELARFTHISISYPDESPSQHIQFVYSKLKNIQDFCYIDGKHEKSVGCETISYNAAMNLESVEYSAGLFIKKSDLAQVQSYRYSCFYTIIF